MKLKGVRSALAGSLAFALAFTALPVNILAAEEADGTKTTLSPVLHWDMTQNDDGTLKDLTGDNHNGIANGDVTFSQIDNIPVLNLNGGYVDIPDGTISSDATEVTVNMLVKITENVKSSWMFCLGASNKRYLYLTGCSSQNGCLRGGAGFVPTDILSTGNGWSYESAIGGDTPLTENEWQNITLTYKDNGDVTFYLNGEKQNAITVSDGKAKGCTLQGLMHTGDSSVDSARDGYMGWSFYTGADPKFKGAVADFQVYEKEMSESEVAALSTELNKKLDSLKNNDFSASDIALSESDCLGENASASAVTSNLVLPSATKVAIKGENKDASITKWVSSNPDVISNDGVVTPSARKNTTVTLTASVTLNGVTVDKELTFTVPRSASDADMLAADVEDLTIPTASDIRGNITLPKKGEGGSSISWSSSDESVIRTTASGKIPAGKVTRQSTDTHVTLTATLTFNGLTATKQFDCTVKKAAKIQDTTDYLFAYFPYTDECKDERIYFGLSEDGLNFSSLNDEKPVLESKLGTHGLRDPFIIRSHEGDKFYLIATDLTVAGVTQDGVTYPGQGWGENQTNGSQSIMVWESEDLVN